MFAYAVATIFVYAPQTFSPHFPPKPRPFRTRGPRTLPAISHSLCLLMALNFISLKTARPYKYALVFVCLALPLRLLLLLLFLLLYVAIDYIVNDHGCWLLHIPPYSDKLRLWSYKCGTNCANLLDGLVLYIVFDKKVFFSILNSLA